MGRPVISLLTDFGARDPSAGILHGVILGIAPDAAIVDISHEVHKFQIRDGALLLWCALPYLPVGSHVAVVDPGVGTARRPVAIRAARGDILIGPDNGLLPAAAERLGGATDAVAPRGPGVPPPRRQHQLPRPRHLRAGGRAPRQRRVAGAPRSGDRPGVAGPVAAPPPGRSRRAGC